jgi:hypothetical protein
VGVYALDLRTGEVLWLTDYKEPRALLDRDTVVITEPCWEIVNTYAIHLE